MNVALARTLRKRMPPAEARMWTILRTEPFSGWHFRRQVPIGRYFADFASHSAKLVIEIDGDTHSTAVALRYDAMRDAFIRAEGYSILRVTNRDVMNNLEGVATTLSAQLAATPTRPLSRAPSPQGGGRTASLTQNSEA